MACPGWDADGDGDGNAMPPWLDARERETTRRLESLVAVLEEDPAHDDVPPVPKHATRAWTEDDIRKYFKSQGTCLGPEWFRHGDQPNQPEGTDAQCKGLQEHQKQREVVHPKEGELTGSEYRRAAVHWGIPFRKFGLFPTGGDAVLDRLRDQVDPVLHPFEKNLYRDGDGGAGDALCPAWMSWASGEEAAKHGIDLRCFIQEEGRDDAALGAKLYAALRYSEKASIGNCYGVHGGAIETALDEATAELAKCHFGVLCFTTGINFVLKKMVNLHQSYLVECEITKVGVGGIRITVDGTIKDEHGTVCATCQAQLANVSKMPQKKV